MCLIRVRLCQRFAVGCGYVGRYFDQALKLARDAGYQLDYWGGVVVYVNGKEAVRRHLVTLPSGK